MRIAKLCAAVISIGSALLCGFLFLQSEDSALQLRAEEGKQSPARVLAGLIALYDFQEDSGPVVKDRSGAGPALDLRIEDLKAVRRSQGALEVRGKTRIRSDKPAAKVVDAIRQSGEITLEAWIRPAKANQNGPARILTLSKHTTERNFTLGQEHDRFDVRFRTTKTDLSGIPSLSTDSKTLQTKLTHVVYTRDRTGKTRIYLDGKPRKEQTIAGDLSNWNGGFELALANELSGERPWEGTFHLVAIYSRGLLPQEVEQNFLAGPQAEGLPSLAQNTARAQAGLMAFYDFQEDSGPIVKDRSGTGQPLDLKIENLNAVRRSPGSVEVRGKTGIRSDKPATKLFDAVRRSGELTLETWIEPAKTTLAGPARILTLSKNSNERNFTLGQEGDKFEVRVRTTKTSTNGLPSLSSAAKTLQTQLIHVVYTRDRAGKTRLYLDGKPREETTIAGDLTNWDGSFQLALANELSGDRPWEGTYHLVAIYSRSLSPQEVEQNFKAGPKAGGLPTELAQNITDAKAQFFTMKIAPIFANHCLECHDSIIKEGGLDLSRKAPAFTGGENGKAIVPGKSAESSIWTRVESDEMPADRPPLSGEEKTLLKQWLDQGADWPVDFIDPALYAHGASSTGIILQRLTRAEYIETVRSAVGVDVSQEALKILPPDLRADGFSNTAYNLNVDLKHIEAYAQLAEIIVSRMDPVAFAGKFNKRRDLEDDTFRDLVGKMGKWLFRGPLNSQEIATYRGIGTTVAATGGDYKEAVALILEAMLQSPRFIYRIENQRGDGQPYPVGAYELASRMSYILWGGPPDEALLKAADSGEILNPEKSAEHARRMLQDPRAKQRSQQFVSDWLNLGRLENMNPDPKKFPKWNAKLAADMRNETLAYFEEIVWKQNRPLSDLLNAQVSFITPELARHYGIPPQGKEMARYDLSSIPSRGGVLTQGSVLTVGGDEASMVTRGLFVLHELLRGVVKDPPPCVDTTPVPTKAGLTLRGVAEVRIANANCGGCHARFEPLAFGLEKFDGLGSHHEQDKHGNKLREDGEILFPGVAQSVQFKTSAELMNLLAESDRVKETLTWKLAQFAMGRPLSATDAPTLETIHQTAQKAGGRYTDLMLAIIQSDLVQKTRTEPIRNSESR